MFKFIIRLTKPYLKLILVVILFQIGQTLLSLYLPTINAGIIDYGVANTDTQYIIQQGVLMVALSAVQFVCAVGANILGAKVALSIGRDLREKVYFTILSYSQKEIGSFGAPTLITRATNDVEQVVQFLTFLFTIIISAPIMFVGGIGMALSQSLSLSAVIWITIPVILGISIAFILKIVPYYRAQQRAIDNINGVLRDQITGIRVAKAFVKEDFEEKKLDGVNKTLFGLNLSISRMTSLLLPIFMLIINIATVAILWYGGVLAENGAVQVGQIIAFITYLSFILTATLSATMVFIMLPRADVSAQRIQEVLNTESSVRQAKNPLSAQEPFGEVKFKNVSYSYAPENPEVEPVLKNITFTASPGKTTAIIGSTGCGKTTLLNLIPRLTDVTDGAVLFDGKDVRDMDISALDSAIGMVPQKAFLFAGTLAQNMRYAKADADDEEIWNALRVAQAEDFIRSNKDGIYMRVSEGGSNYSGGQRQRLAIARAIVRRPKVYLFDDSFSALDYATDKNLRSALKEITSDATVIVVAQRITSIMDADQIIVMNNGEIEDIGTHEELLERCATYQEIASTQPSEEAEASK